ncbi:MAG: hypothetical protein IJU74_04755 [Bacteroidales bacterium]|nr:hypothetical protein [Bacteroidales bacterium]MBQ7610391.1 hypothetical protein [Bacteroidales bacterium]MBR0300959.1 hypothetical protein [Bacteroidales bacterium]
MKDNSYEAPRMGLVSMETRQTVAVASNGYEISNFTDEGDLFGDEVI